MPRKRNLTGGAIWGKTGNGVIGTTSKMCTEKLQLYFTSCSLDISGPGMGGRECHSVPRAAFLPTHLPFCMAKAAQFTTQRAVWEGLSQNEINLDVFWALEAEMLKMVLQLEGFCKEKLFHRFNLLQKHSWKTSPDTNHKESHWFLCKIMLHYSLQLAKLILLTPEAESIEEVVNVMKLLLHRQQKMMFCGFVIANLTAVRRPKGPKINGCKKLFMGSFCVISLMPANIVGLL